MISINIPEHILDLDYISTDKSSKLTTMEIRKHLRYMWTMSSTLRKYQFPLTNTGSFIWKITDELKQSITDYR